MLNGDTETSFNLRQVESVRSQFILFDTAQTNISDVFISNPNNDNREIFNYLDSIEVSRSISEATTSASDVLSEILSLNQLRVNECHRNIILVFASHGLDNRYTEQRLNELGKVWLTQINSQTFLILIAPEEEPWCTIGDTWLHTIYISSTLEQLDILETAELLTQLVISDFV